MQVILINPPSKKRYITPPLGLLYLANGLLDSYEVHILDLDAVRRQVVNLGTSNNMTCLMEFALKDIGLKDYLTKTLLVGIGPIMTPNIKESISTIKEVRKFFLNAYIICGGPHFRAGGKMMADEFFMLCPEINRIVVGEGEESIKKIAEYLRKHELNDDLFIEGTYIPNHRWTEGFSSNFASIDLLPRHLLERYEDIYGISPRRTYLKKCVKTAILFTSRGCPYKCAFCASLSRRRIRPVDSIIEELQSLMHDGYGNFVFYDDLLSLNSSHERQRIKQLCLQISNRQLDISWQCELRADAITFLGAEVLRLMRDSGCGLINMGIEKTTDEGLARVVKGMSYTEVVRAIHLIKEAGIRAGGTFIIGGPGENLKEAKRNVNRSSKLPIDEGAWYTAGINPGTEFYKEALKEGIIKPGLGIYVNSGGYPCYYPKGATKSETGKLEREAYRRFYLTPSKIYESCCNLGLSALFLQSLWHRITHSSATAKQIDRLIEKLYRYKK